MSLGNFNQRKGVSGKKLMARKKHQLTLPRQKRAGAKLGSWGLPMLRSAARLGREFLYWPNRGRSGVVGGV